MVAVAEEFIITGWFDYGDHRDAVLTEFRECARRSRDEPGCLDYWVSADPEDAGRIRVFERWESEAHLAEHFTTEHVTGFRTAIAPYTAQGPRRAALLHLPRRAVPVVPPGRRVTRLATTAIRHRFLDASHSF